MSLETLTVHLLVLQLSRTLLACLLVLLAVSPLAVHAAVLHEAAGRAVLELDGVTSSRSAVGTCCCGANHGHAAHCQAGMRCSLFECIPQVIVRVRVRSRATKDLL